MSRKKRASLRREISNGAARRIKRGRGVRRSVAAALSSLVLISLIQYTPVMASAEPLPDAGLSLAPTNEGSSVAVDEVGSPPAFDQAPALARPEEGTAAADALSRFLTDYEAQEALPAAPPVAAVPEAIPNEIKRGDDVPNGAAPDPDTADPDTADPDPADPDTFDPADPDPADPETSEPAELGEAEVVEPDESDPAAPRKSAEKSALAAAPSSCSVTADGSWGYSLDRDPTFESPRDWWRLV